MNKYNIDLFYIHLFEIENLNLLFINLLLMIQLYIPWEGEGDCDENLRLKHRTGH
jgi:hypothetical protein